MSLLPSVFFGLLFVSGTLAVAVAALAWRERRKSGAEVMAVVLLVIALWAYGQAIMFAGTSLPIRQLGFDVSMVGYLSIPPLWLLYTVLYTGTWSEYVPRPLVTAVIVPFGWTVVVATNSIHRLLYVDAGLRTAGSGVTFTYEWTTAYWVLINLEYLLVAVAIWLLVRKFFASRNVYRRRTSFFIVASFSLTACHAVSQYGLSPVPQFSLGPLFFLSVDVLSLLAFVSYRGMQFVPVNRLVRLFGFRSKSLTPLARETVLEEMQGGVVVVDHKNRVVDINPIGKRLLGIDQRVVGKPIDGLLPPSCFVADDPVFLTTDATEGVHKGQWFEPTDGQSRCLDVTVSLLTADDGEAVGRVLLLHDVTERERRKRKLEHKNEQLDSFASVVSHDLRNPLNVAQGSVTLLEDDADDEHVERLQQSIQRMEQIIEDVLTLARQGQSVDDPTTVDVMSTARQAWEVVDTAVATLEVDGDVTLQADERRLQQVFENLFRNAVEHGSTDPDSQARQDAVEHNSTGAEGTNETDDARGSDVTVTVGAIDGGTGFYVADDGRGIPEDEREEVLEKGFTTAADGTGFGLAIVRTIVEAHGWTITVTESESGGARFEILTHSDAADEEALIEPA
jgi:PAS domain S-box-containing protein